MKRILNVSDNILENKKLKTSNIIEDAIINYISVPSLESIAIVNVAINLCKQSDIRDALRLHSLEFDPVGGDVHTIRGTSYNKSFDQINKNILCNLSLLPLPNLLKAKVATAVRPIELQILKWIRYDRKDVEYMDSICWTSEGTIDRIKTLEQLIAKESGQYIHSTYRLACKYCLEDSIPNLWKKLPEEVQKDICSNRTFKTYDNHLMVYWTSVINNELSRLFSKIVPNDHQGLYNCSHSFYRNMLALALSTGNSVAVKHFWNKLTAAEIDNNLSQWINVVVNSIKHNSYYQDTNEYADILYFLLSKMNDVEQQKEIFKKNIDVILNSLFLYFPWRRFLMPTIQVMWEFIDEKVYDQLLRIIVPEIQKNKTTGKLLRELWYESPMNLKNYFTQQILNDYLGPEILCSLLIVEDLETVKVILNDITIEERKQIIFSLIERNGMFFKVLYNNKFFLFDTVIEVLSETDINCIKKKIVMNYGNKLCHDWICEDNWKMVKTFFKWSFSSEEQSDYFKNKLIDKIEITYSLIQQGDYKLINKFIDWCFDSEQKINQFKKEFSKSKLKIVEIGCEDWSSFEKFTDWCFGSEQEVNEFKLVMLQSHEMSDIIYSNIAYGYSFEYIDKLINWCCDSNNKIKEYKAEYVLSENFIANLQRFVSNYKVYDSEWNNWELIKKLMKLFSPFEKDVIIKLKEKITACIDFDDFRGDFRNISVMIEKVDLFRLIDNDNYNLGDYESSNDSDCASNDCDHNV